ncbi:MAG: FtsX-like permease family protein [Microscillaceae bacterium]|nr:FtsX-like permease family protein [Microscillaceae bacterium]
MNSNPGFSWILLMAWRDTRKNLGRLLLFISSIILGIAALVAINSFGDNLRNDIENEAKELLGADFEIGGRQQPSPVIKAILDSLEGLSVRTAHEISFASMILLPKSQATRLVNVRALEGDFPFYGDIETKPSAANKNFRKSKKALIDKTVLLQFNAVWGDPIKIGNATFTIEGELEKAPGQNNIASTVAPKVYIPMRYLKETDLVKKGSRLVYRYYFEFKPGVDPEKISDLIKDRLRKEDYGLETVASQKEDLGDAFSFLTRFLNLVAFVALLLGCVGVSSAVQIYLKEKLNTVAVLRCLGAKGNQTFWIYLLQILGMGLVGSVLGAIVGSFIQVILPEVLKDFLPLEVSYSVSWPAIFQGILIGVSIAALFALIPLLSVRKISPLRTLRASFEEGNLHRDPIRWLVYLLVVGFVYGFSYIQIRSLQESLYFTLFIVFSFFLLGGAARLLMWLVRRYFPVSWNYVWRQGLANLYRPNNQTLILIVSIGLGTALMSTLYFIQSLLLSQVSLSDRDNQPNMILFDIQSDQIESVAELTRESKLPVLQELPIVAMRLAEFKGKTRTELLNDSILDLPRDVLNREYRVTYRDTLDINEKLVEGKLGKAITSPKDTIYVSVSQDHARRMKAKVGDVIVFNVQGAIVKTVIGSIRKLDLTRFRTSFTFLFPSGVLEKAPQFHVLITRVNSDRQSAEFQQKLIREFPNISVVDISLVLKTAEEILDEVSFVIRFMALFSILTGLIVLVGSVMISKFQRIQESVLLRTLGANRRQIVYITLLEYFFLGSLAALTGIALSLIATWALAVYSFDVTFSPDLTPVIYIYLIITGLTMSIGMLNTRSILNKPPLEVLRNEVA